METIFISGYSGTGKSTFAKKIASKLPNAERFDADYFMFSSIKYYKKEFESIFGKKLDYDNYANCYLRVTDAATFEQYNEYHHLSMPFVNDKIDEIVKFKKSQKLNFFVVDWISFPKLTIWRENNYRVMVDSKEDTRHTNLVERLKKEGFTGNGYAVCKIRDMIVSEIIENAENITHRIENNFNGHLDKYVDAFCDEVLTNEKVKIIKKEN